MAGFRCPDCHGALSEGAVKCRCGWKSAELHETFTCAHDGCKQSAILRRRLNGAVVNLCRHHHEFHVSQEARAYAEKLGLMTVEQMRAYCKAMIPLIGRRTPEIEREPGQDDEEIAA